MRIRKELWFGFSLMAVIIATILLFTPWGALTNGHLGLLMLALVVVTIMLGFPTAFTLMGMGVFFAWLAYRSVNPDLAVRQVLDLMVQRTYAGYFYAADSWRINEHSNVTADGPPIYPFKTIIPLAGAFLLAQGVVEIVRCAICIRDGAWPSREEDVEEVDVDKLKEMVHANDAGQGGGRS